MLDAPANMVAELVNGALHLHPRPASRHARRRCKLGARLDDPFDNGIGGPGGWFLAIEPELHLGDDVLVPDLAGWRRERMARVSRRPGDRARPDWVCEILSPGTRRFDLTEKRARYGDRRRRPTSGSSIPRPGLLEAFALRDGAWALARRGRRATKRCASSPSTRRAFPLSALWP